MRYFRRNLATGGIVSALLLLAGCLVSGTFVVVYVHDKPFIAQDEFYFYDVDITGESVWKDHRDKIKDIDLVGFELWITNNESAPRKFSIYLDGPDEPEYTTLEEVQDNATIVLEGLPLPAGPGGKAHVTYGQSFKYLRNVPTLLKLVESGKFNYYGISDGGASAGYTIDKAKVIITFTAGT